MDLIIIQLTLTCLLGVFLFDVFLVGFFTSILGIHPAYLKIKKDILIEDKSFENGVSTNLFAFHKVVFRSIILTHKFIYIRNTYFACARSVNLDKANCFSIKRPVLNRLLMRGFRVTIKLNVDDEEKFFSFDTKLRDAWEEKLIGLGINNKP